MHFRHTFATFLPKNLYFLKFGGENSNLAEFYSRFGGQLSISSGTADNTDKTVVLHLSSDAAHVSASPAVGTYYIYPVYSLSC